MDEFGGFESMPGGRRAHPRIASRAPWYAVRWRHRNPEPAARRVPHHRARDRQRARGAGGDRRPSAMVAVGSILVMAAPSLTGPRAARGRPGSRRSDNGRAARRRGDRDRRAGCRPRRRDGRIPENRVAALRRAVPDTLPQTNRPSARLVSCQSFSSGPTWGHGGAGGVNRDWPSPRPPEHIADRTTLGAHGCDRCRRISRPAAMSGSGCRRANVRVATRSSPVRRRACGQHPGWRGPK
jgi:hypothetical protein